MQDNFEKCLSLVLVHEGGYSNHPSDPGRETNMGITRRTLAAWRGLSDPEMLPVVEIKNLTKDEAAQIYRAQYWNAVNGDALPAGVDYCIFDYAVNSGPSRAVKELQKAVGTPVDGIVGGHTLAAVRSHDPADIVNAVCDRRMAFLRRLRTWKHFGRGWARRVSGVRRQGIHMAGMEPPTVVANEPAGKGLESDIKTTEVAKEKAKGAEGAVVGGGIGVWLTEMAQKLWPFASYSQAIKWAFVALLLAGAAFLVVKYVKKYRAGEIEL